MMRIFPLFFKRRIIAILLALVTMVPFPVFADENYVGMVKTYQPLAVVIHNSVEIPISIGTKLYLGDIVVTKADAAVGIIFMDGSVLSLGSETHFEIVDFLFKPAEHEVSFISKVSQGTAAFTSGAIGRISPESVKFITPTSTLGLHGTKVLIEVK